MTFFLRIAALMLVVVAAGNSSVFAQGCYPPNYTQQQVDAARATAQAKGVTASGEESTASQDATTATDDVQALYDLSGFVRKAGWTDAQNAQFQSYITMACYLQATANNYGSSPVSVGSFL